MQRMQEAGGLPEYRHDARVRSHCCDALRGSARPEIDGRCLAHDLVLRCACKDRSVLLQRARYSFRAWWRALVQLRGEEPRLLVRQVELRMLSQHLVKRRRPALTVPDDEEVGQP